MKKTCFFIAIFILSFIAHIQAVAIPDLIGPDDFPVTLSSSNTVVDLDVNDDGTRDFRVSYSSLSSTSFTCEIYTMYLLAAPGAPLTATSRESKVMYEEVGAPDSPPQSPVPLSSPTIEYATLLTTGSIINSEQQWGHGAFIAGDNVFFSPPLAPTDTYNDGVTDGYMGIEYTVGSETYYGWIQTQIDDVAMTVTLNSMWLSPAPSAPAFAGLTNGSTVPVPFLASIAGFLVIGASLFFRRKRKK